MPLESIYSFLTYPKKNQPDDPLASGTEIPTNQESKLYQMLDVIFQRAENDFNVPIIFTTEDGKQDNQARTELLGLLSAPSVATASPLALRLQRATTGTSGMGLMFFCIGRDGKQTRIVLCRFPADEGVVAERTGDDLTVQFVEQVFLKSAHAFKAATFIADGRADQLWVGNVIDRQINNGSKAVADYWIVSFLMAEFATTPAAGTKRLALAMRAASESTDSIRVKQEIVSASSLAPNIPKRAMTIASFCGRLNFSDETTQAVLSKVNPARLIREQFRFDAAEFEHHLQYRQVELDNGAILTAPSKEFESIFKDTARNGKHTFTTTGEIVNQRLKSSK
jgi:hypothetical protein